MFFVIVIRVVIAAICCIITVFYIYSELTQLYLLFVTL